jgi:hypothetical protein
MAKLKVNKRKIGHVPENVFAGYLACFGLWAGGTLACNLRPWRGATVLYVAGYCVGRRPDELRD